MRNLFLILTLIVLGGCNSILAKEHGSANKSYELDEKWLPLEEIQERGAILGTAIKGGSIITTVGHIAYVENIEEWIARHPPESIAFEAIMTHEQVHARRQLRTGLYKWITRYLVDKKFALAEEKLGYYHQMKLDMTLQPETVAKFLSTYKISTGSIVSYADALAWARDARSGKWKPEED